MGQKDLVSKQLENYPDVFADIVNVFVYDGKRVILEDELEPAPTETFYKSNSGELRNQFHDVSKYQMINGTRQVQYTLENEISSKRKTVFRKAGYAGAVYREQYDGKEEFPFVSLLLYWGKGRWKKPRSLEEMFVRKTLPQELMKYVDEIKLHVYDMRSLSADVRQLFRSDMRLVVDYLAEGTAYVPTKQKIVHVEAFLNMMYWITGDERYIKMIEEALLVEKEGEEVTMCEILDGFIERGIQQGIKQGISQGISQGETLLASLMNYLFVDNRLEEAKQVTTDEKRRKELYQEYGLI